MCLGCVCGIWVSCSMERCRKGAGNSLAAESQSLHKASEKGHRAGRKSLARATPGRRGGKNWVTGDFSGFAEGYKKPRENKVTAEINRPELLLKDRTGLGSYSAPVKIT